MSSLRVGLALAGAFLVGLAVGIVAGWDQRGWVDSHAPA